MSKLFRARQLDAAKPMPIFMSEEIPDLEEYLAVNRAVPELPSGVLKEEEREHHLQRAIDTGLIIPTPDTEAIDPDIYNRLYPTNYKTTRQLIRVQPFDIEQDIADFDMDSEDEAWINAHKNNLNITPHKFEEMMDCLENNGHSIITQYEAKLLLKEDDDLLIAVYDYWLNKRLKNQYPLIPRVKTEAHLLGNSYNHPYLAFQRRRKMLHTRKKQKNRELSYQKMHKLRRDLMRALKLLELIKRRENAKKQLLQLTINIFEKRYRAGDFSGQMLCEVTPVKSPRSVFAPITTNQLNPSAKEIVPRKEKHQYKRRKIEPAGETVSNSDFTNCIGISAGDYECEEAQSRDFSASGSSPILEETPFAFHRSRFTLYRRPVKSPLQLDPGSSKPLFRQTSIKTPRCVISGTGRIGRGGRLVMKSKFPSLSYDNFWEDCDYTIHDNTHKNLQTANDQTEPFRLDIEPRNNKDLSDSLDLDSQSLLSLGSDPQLILQVEDLTSSDDCIPLQLNFGDLFLAKETASLDSDSTHFLDMAMKSSADSNQEGHIPHCDISSYMDVRSYLAKEMQKDLSIDNKDLAPESSIDVLLSNKYPNSIETPKRESGRPPPVWSSLLNGDSCIGHSSFNCI